MDTDLTPPQEDTVENPPEPEPTPIKVAGKEYKDMDAVLKALTEANKTIGRLGQRLGDPKKETVEYDPEPEYDPYDKNKLANWTAWNARQLKQELKAEQERERQNSLLQEQQRSIKRFTDSHQDMSFADMRKVAEYAEDKGTDLESAYDEMVKRKMFVQPGIKEKNDKLEEADKVHSTLSEPAAPGKTDIDGETIDKITDENLDYLDKLTPEQTEAWLAGEL